MGEGSGWNRDGRNRSMNIDFDFALLVTETSKGPETHVLGQTRSHELEIEKSLRGMDTWVRRTVEKIKKSLAELLRNKRVDRSRRDITEQGSRLQKERRPG